MYDKKQKIPCAYILRNEMILYWDFCHLSILSPTQNSLTGTGIFYIEGPTDNKSELVRV